MATAQDDITGDGTTSNVLIIGELLKQADLYISEGLHPSIITEGFDKAKDKALEVRKSEMVGEVVMVVIGYEYWGQLNCVITVKASICITLSLN